MGRKTVVQSQVESYQRLRKCYLIPPCLTLSIIRYVSRVKWSNPGKGVAAFLIPQCSSYWKGSFRVALDYSHQLYFLTLYIFLFIFSLSLAIKFVEFYILFSCSFLRGNYFSPTIIPLQYLNPNVSHYYILQLW